MTRRTNELVLYATVTLGIGFAAVVLVITGAMAYFWHNLGPIP